MTIYFTRKMLRYLPESGFLLRATMARKQNNNKSDPNEKINQLETGKIDKMYVIIEKKNWHAGEINQGFFLKEQNKQEPFTTLYKIKSNTPLAEN